MMCELEDTKSFYETHSSIRTEPTLLTTVTKPLFPNKELRETATGKQFQQRRWIWQVDFR